MRKILLFVIFGTTLIFLAGNNALFAQRGGRSGAGETLEVKLASPLPRESPWGRTLDRIAAEWNRITRGQVRLNVRHGGIEGAESKMLLSLGSDIIQGAVLTSFGLNVIDPVIMTMSAPFLIRNEQELAAVLPEVQDELEARINSGKYFMLAWSKSGFVNIFSKELVLTPDDLRRMKTASNEEAAEINTAFKSMGFQITEGEWTEIGPRLNAGTVTALYQNPAAVAAFQLHTVVKNMLTINIAPILGGLVLNQVTWKKIGDLNPRYQQELLNATRRIAADFDNSLQKTVTGAVQTMSRAGLKVNRPTQAQEQLWYAEMEKTVPSLLAAGAFDRNLYQKVSDILARYRRGGR